MIHGIIAKELNELCKDNHLDRTNVGVNYNSDDEETKSLVDFVSKSENIDIKDSAETFSVEWPAVISLLTFRYSDKFRAADFEKLYIAVSRARVMCTVIMFPAKSFELDDIHQLQEMLDELEDSAEIRRYP